MTYPNLAPETFGGFSLEKPDFSESALISAGYILLNLFNTCPHVKPSPHSNAVRTLWLSENQHGIRLPEIEDASIMELLSKMQSNDDDIFALLYEPRSVMGRHTDNTSVTNLTVLGNGVMRIYSDRKNRDEYQSLELTPGSVTRTSPDVEHLVINANAPRLVLSSLPIIQ
jgi:hypothetical protein